LLLLGGGGVVLPPMRIYDAGKAGQESCDLDEAECHLHTLSPETVELDQS
jgi:hypothetical protein